MRAEHSRLTDIGKRGFLRHLCALPMIGGSVALIGQPTAAAVPVTQHLLDAYDEWLFYERRLLHVERFGLNASRETTKFVPCASIAVDRFFFPSMESHSTRPPWMDQPKPSTRSALVLSAVGIDLTGDDSTATGARIAVPVRASSPPAPAPIFAAIEAHRVAWEAFNDAVDQTDGRADKEGREMNATERAQYKQDNDDEESAWEALLEHPCRSADAMRAKATYLLDCPRTKGLSWQETHVEALLTSLTGGARG